MSYEENTEFPCREVPEHPIATYQPWWYPMSPKDGNPSPYGPPNHQMYPNPYWNGKSNTQPHIYGFKDRKLMCAKNIHVYDVISLKIHFLHK